jgi:trigger factor
MKTEIESLSNLQRKMNVEVPSNQVDAEFINAFKYLQKSVEVKGFRKGKTPIPTIRSMYAEKIKGDVAQNLVQTFYFKALKEHDVIPVGMPDIDFQNPEEGKDFAFTAQFEVQPDIELKQTKGLEVKKEKIEITDEQVDKNIEQILENQSKLEDVVLIRDLKHGDYADIDFKGLMDGQPLENGAAQGHVLEIGSDSFIPGFEQGLIGMKPGDSKTVSLSFPEDYHVEHLKGKPVTFEVTLNKIKEKIKPELNDEFVKSLGEHNTVDEFKAQLKKDITEGEEKRAESELKNRLFKSLVEANPFDVPETLVKEQRSALVEDFKRRMQGQGIGEQEFAEYEEKWTEDFSDTAQFMVRSALLIQKIAKDNELNASKEDVAAKLQEITDQTGLDLSQVKEFYKQGQQSANLEFQVTEDKVFKFLLENAKVEEVATEELTGESEAPNAEQP